MSHNDSEKLSSYFDDLYETLLSHGVPEDRLPSPWHVLSRVLEAIDHDLLSEWVDAYVALESDGDPSYNPTNQNPEQDSNPPSSQPGPWTPPRRQPNYLRALPGPPPTDPSEPTPPDSEGSPKLSPG